MLGPESRNMEVSISSCRTESTRRTGDLLTRRRCFRLAVGRPTAIACCLLLLAGLTANLLLLRYRMSIESSIDLSPLPGPRLDVSYTGTPPDVVDTMLALANPQQDERVYDLGCGDGRVVVQAATKFGCRAFGCDIDPRRVKASLENVRQNRVDRLVKIAQRNIFDIDLSGANVVTLYLLPHLNVRLIPQFKKLRPGARIVSHNHRIEGVEPERVVTMVSQQDKRRHTIYLWTAPLKVR